MKSVKKEIINNIISFSLIDILGLLIPIITMPILTRALGVEVYGQYLLFMSVIFFGHTIIDYGVQYVGVRSISNTNDKHTIANMYEGFQGIRWLFGMVYIVFMAIYFSFFIENTITDGVVVYSSLYIVGYIFTSAWFYQAKMDMRILMLITLFSRLINLIVILFFIDSPEDIDRAILGATVPVFFSGVLLYYIIRRDYNCRLLCVNGIGNRIKSGFNVFVGILAPNLYNALPVIVMGAIYGAVDFALFAVGMRICGIILTVQGVLSKSVFPYLSRSKGEHVSEMMAVNLLISIPIVLYFYIFGDVTLCFLLGDDYSDNVYLDVLLIGMIFLSIASSFGEGYLIPKGYDRLYRDISYKVSIFSAIINVILIYFFGIFGGAVGLTFARFMFALVFYIGYRKVRV
ncbi:oligosaccharide flippase family protein [Vibrio furnissii]|uniref:oligosaccharide flippase family protein n=1 Tax=Vibrio furnissii TaxID=29494 RepID=UPI0024B88276|nr:oligosaccharide flippase family protein [Vibrio furnissii]WHR51323.1 oligosaccharide flippase family protein [Vibrio furnissii]